MFCTTDYKKTYPIDLICNNQVQWLMKMLMPQVYMWLLVSQDAQLTIYFHTERLQLPYTNLSMSRNVLPLEQVWTNIESCAPMCEVFPILLCSIQAFQKTKGTCPAIAPTHKLVPMLKGHMPSE